MYIERGSYDIDIQMDYKYKEMAVDSTVFEVKRLISDVTEEYVSTNFI